MVNRILAVDFGSTTTKLILFEKDQVWKKVIETNAPTTVEKPVADVTVGLMNAIKELEEITNIKFWNDNKFINLDLFLATSSAGGGLQILVTGITKEFSARLSSQASLGAGAIILDSISLEDSRVSHQISEDIRELKPDIIILSGGTNNGATSQIIDLAQIILEAESKPRFGTDLKTPVIFAGNQSFANNLKSFFGETYKVITTENILPSLDKYNGKPLTNLIHELFMEHVMSQSPGYNKIKELTNHPILPTPSAVGNMIESFSKNNNYNVLAVDIGGATTDIYSTIQVNDDLSVVRSVSANLGMSYSIANVLKETGIDNIKRWLDFDFSENEINDIIRNKMVRPSTIPSIITDVKLEQAIAREALSLSLKHHENLFYNNQKPKTFFSPKVKKGIDLNKITHIVGAGGILSNSLDRLTAAQILIESFNPQGITEILIDSVFMLPHLGAINQIDSKIAEDLLISECLLPVCIHIAPTGKGKIAEVVIDNKKHILKNGDLKIIEFNSEDLIIKTKNETINFTSKFNYKYVILDGRNGDFLNRKLSYEAINVNS